MDKIIALAAERGSTATTHAGARRWLLAHLPAALPFPGTAAWRLVSPYERRLPRRTATPLQCGLGVRLISLYRRHPDLQQASITRWDGHTVTLDHATVRRLVEGKRMEAHAEEICAAMGLPTWGDVATAAKRALEAGWPLRHSESRWAGGDHCVWVTVSHTRPAASGRTEKVWSENKKWSGTDSYADLSITSRALQEFGADGLIQDGLIMLDAERVGVREYRAAWAAQARGVDLKVVHGWLIRGYHSTASTIERARREVAKARRAAVIAAQAVRVQRLDFAATKRAAATVYIAIEDSLAAGNCRAATEQVAATVRRHLGGEVAAVRGDVLLDLVDAGLRDRAVRAIEVARTRHQRAA